VAANVAYLASFLRAHLAGLVVPVRPEATYLVWLNCAGLLRALGLQPGELHGWVLRHAKLCLSAGEEFAPESGHCLRMNVACPRAMLRAAAERLRDAVRAEMRRGGSATGACTQGNRTF
jgi:cystathionine beta-lyase